MFTSKATTHRALEMVISLVFLVASSICLVGGLSAPQYKVPKGSPRVDYWFSFGDSYTTTGFAINGTLPTPDNPLGNPPYPGYTAADGTNWIDVDTTVYNKSLILTYNYAYGGATIDASLVKPYMPAVLSLTDQVNEFLSTAAMKPASAPWTSSNTLFSIWIGINDIGNSYYSSGNRSKFSDTLLNAEFALVQKLYHAGARNFLWLNVPPIDRSPLMLKQSAVARAKEKSVITDFNTKLANKVLAFQDAHHGTQTWLWASNAAFTAVLNSPTSYGFNDATSYGAIGDFWGNDYHPSSAAHDIWGKEIASLLGHTSFR